MIRIYRLSGDFGNPRYTRVADWNNGRFTINFAEDMPREEVIKQFNQGYYKTSEIR